MMKPAALFWILAGLAWLLGLGALQVCERLPGGSEVAALLTALVVFGMLLRISRWALLPLALLLAFAQGAWRAQIRLDQALPWAWEGRDVQLIGRVDSLPARIEGQGGVQGWRFEFELESASESGRPLKLPPRLLLSIFGDAQSAPAVRAGERWRWTARLKRAHGLLNPEGFDYELWLFDQNLRATGNEKGQVHFTIERLSFHSEGREILNELEQQVAANGRSALLTGDIEAPQERELVASGANLRSDLLMAPHHGSRTSSSEELLIAVQPRVAVIQAGYRNRFGHPALPVLARLQAHGAGIVDSSRCGAFRWRSDEPGIDGHCERAADRRYWRDVPAPSDAPINTGPWPEFD